MLRREASMAIAGLAALIVLAPGQVLAVDVVYRTVAVAEVTDVPEGGDLTDIYNYSLDEGRLVIEGYSGNSDPSIDGLWAAEGNRLETVATTDTTIPGNIFQFVGFDSFGQDGAATVFVGRYPDACDANDCEGVYVEKDGGYRLVADTFDTVPDRETTFDSLGSPAMEGEHVAFVGSVQDSNLFESGVYADLGDGLITVADWETPIPGGQGFFRVAQFEAGLSLENGVIYFSAWDSETGENGFYAWDSASDTFATLRDQNTRVPGSNRRFNGTWADRQCGGTYAFIGEYAGFRERGVFADFGDGLVQVIAESDLFDDDAENAFYYFEQLSVCGDNIVLHVMDEQTFTASVFLYQRAKDSLTLLMQRGDRVGGRTIEEMFIAPRSVSGDAVAIGVRFLNSYRAGIVIASPHEPGHRLLVSPDHDGNGYEEIVMLRQEGTSGHYVAKVYDAYTGGALWTVPLGARPVNDFGLLSEPERPLRIAVVFEALSGRTILDYVVAPNGNRQQRIQLWSRAESRAIAMLADLNGNGTREVAVAAVVGNNVKIELREGRSGNRLAAYTAVKGLDLQRMLAVDDAAGTPAIVLVGESRNGTRNRAVMVDALAGTVLYSVEMGSATGGPVHDAAMVDDQDGDGVPELVIARTFPANGRSGWQVWNVVTGTRTSARFNGIEVTDLHLAIQPDVGGDGQSEVGLMRVKADGTSIVHIDDPAAAVTLGRYRMGAVEYGQAVAPLAPLDANAAAEFVVLGEHFGTDMLEIHDSADGQPLRYFYLP